MGFYLLPSTEDYVSIAVGQRNAVASEFGWRDDYAGAKSIPFTPTNNARDVALYWKSEVEKLTSEGLLDSRGVTQHPTFGRWFTNQVPELIADNDGTFLDVDATENFWWLVDKTAIDLMAYKITPSSWTMFVDSIDESLRENSFLSCFLNPGECLNVWMTWLKWGTILGVGGWLAWSLLKRSRRA